MPGRKGKQSGSMLASSIFRGLLVTIVLTVVVLSVTMYANFHNIVLDYIYEAEKNSVQQTAHCVNVMTDMVATYATQMYADPHIYGLLRKQNPTAVEQTDGLNQLFAFRCSSSSRFISSIYAYNRAQGKVYIASTNMYCQRIYDTASFFDKEIADVLDNNLSLGVNSPIVRSVPLHGYGDEAFGRANVYTFIFSDMPIGGHPISSALIINVSERWIKDSIASMDAGHGYGMLVVDGDGLAVSGNAQDVFLSNLSDEPYVQRVLAATDGAGYFVEDANGQETLIIYATNSALGWRFIRTIPYGNILNEIHRSQINTLLISLGTLVMGMGVFYLVFRWLRKPLDMVVSRLHTLEQQNKVSQYPLRQDYLRRLVRDPTLETEDVLAKLKPFGIYWQTGTSYKPVLFLVDRFAEFCDKYNLEDRINLKRGIIDMAVQALEHPEQAALIDMQDDKLLLVLPASKAAPPESVARALQARVNESMRFTVTVICGRLLDLPNQLHDAYQCLTGLGRYRAFYGRASFLCQSNLADRTEDSFHYSKSKEDKLVGLLQQNRVIEAEQVFLEINEQAQEGTCLQYYNALVRIAFAIFSVISMKEQYTAQFTSNQVGAFIAQMEKLELAEEIEAHFHHLFTQIDAWQKNKKRIRVDNLQQQMEAQISEHYANPDLSVGSMADMLGLSPVYFGRLFKKMYGKPFLHYLTKTRVERAMDLLATTDLPNEQIAEKVGYTSVSYYYKVFKKHSGTTPSEYKATLKSKLD